MILSAFRKLFGIVSLMVNGLVFLGKFTGKPHDPKKQSNFRWESAAPGAECKLGALGVLLSGGDQGIKT